MTLKISRRDLPADGHCLGQGLHPVLDRIYRSRNVAHADELDLSLRGLRSYHSLAGIEEATELLLQVIYAGGRILVVGDFDADGATGCAVAVRGLRALGATQVDYLVPNRFDFGYGLTPEIVDVALRREPDLIVTVDNGISSIDGVAVANDNGIRVLITDHHLPGEELPSAAAIVNPKLPGCEFPSKSLAGVGVMFYVLSALRARLRDEGWFVNERPEPRLAELLDLVALGTVADVVPLDRNNRILVAQGLARIRAGQCHPGLLALLEVAGRDHTVATASDIGFAIGPRLNAAGRLDDMSLGVACLMADDADRAKSIAVRLDTLNRQRREIEADMRADAMTHVEAIGGLNTNGLPCALCLFESHWHPGVIGIVAGRVKDRVHRPVLAFAPDGDEVVKGSARSIPGVHIRDVLAAVDARHPGLIQRFGGHAMAAGLSLQAADFERFDLAVSHEVERIIDPSALQDALTTDGELEAADMGLTLARAIRDGGPWGSAFPEPLFDGCFEVVEQRIVGDKHLKLMVRPDDGRLPVAAIAFNALEEVGNRQLRRVQLAYRLAVNAWRGRENAELVVERIEGIS